MFALRAADHSDFQSGRSRIESLRIPLSLGSAHAPSTEPDTAEFQIIFGRRRMELVWFRKKLQADRHRIWRMEAPERDPVLVGNARLLFRAGVQGRVRKPACSGLRSRN